MAFEATAVCLLVSVTFTGSHTAESLVLSTFEQQVRSDLINAYFAEDDFFNCPVTYNHGAPINVQSVYSGYFEDPSKNYSAGYPGNIVLLHPVVELPRTALLQYPTMGDTLSVKNCLYRPVRIDDDGTGVVKIYLVRQGRGR